MESLGEKLKNLRDFYGTTIRDLSSKTGVGQSTISEIETGKAKNPKIDTLQKIASYFDVTTDYLMGVVPFKNKVEAQHSISIATVKFLKEKPDECQDCLDAYSGLEAMYDEIIKVSKEIYSYCQSLVSKFDSELPLNNIEFMELSSIMFYKIKWSTDYDGIVHIENYHNQFFTIKLDFKQIPKIIVDLDKSFLFKNKDQNKFKLEEVTTLFDFPGNGYEERELVKDCKDSHNLTDEDILTKAAQLIGHHEPLTDDDFAKIKLAIKISLAKNDS